MTPTTKQMEARTSAKDVICALVAAAGGALRGKVRLNKAFYFAHLYYWRDSDGVLTEYPIVRLPLGPCIDDVNDLLAELVDEGRISISKAPNGPFEEFVYRHVDPVPSIDDSTPRGRAIRQAISFVEDKTAAELSEITHEHSPTWQTTPDGSEMNIYLDLVDENEFKTVRKRLRDIRKREGEVWTAEF